MRSSLPGVQAAADVETDALSVGDDRRGRADGSGGPVERGEETVAGRVLPRPGAASPAGGRCRRSKRAEDLPPSAVLDSEASRVESTMSTSMVTASVRLARSPHHRRSMHAVGRSETRQLT